MRLGGVGFAWGHFRGAVRLVLSRGYGLLHVGMQGSTGCERYSKMRLLAAAVVGLAARVICWARPVRAKTVDSRPRARRDAQVAQP